MVISELQIALLGAGVTAIAVVWAYNGWQERKHRRAAERLFKGEQADALMKDAPPDSAATVAPVSAEVSERIEPTFEPVEPVFSAPSIAEPLPEPAPIPVPVPAPVFESVPEVVEPVPPVKAAAPAQPPAAPVPPVVTVASAVVEPTPVVVIDTDVSPADMVADCVVRFSLPTAIPALDLWHVQADWSSRISKPLMWLGRNPGDAAWRFVTADAVGRYSEWVAALQLADRQGAVSDLELSQFLDGLGRLGAHFGVEIDLPDGVETLHRAQSLDAFCASVDVQFGIHVVEAAGNAFAGTKLRGVCEAAGLVLGKDGCFHSIDDNGAEEFRIANIGSEGFSAENIRTLVTHGVTLTIDVPRVTEGAAAFNRMITTAQQLARGLGGVLVDTQRAPLADAMINGIRAKIIEMQQQMKAAEIAPGSARALKLFV